MARLLLFLAWGCHLCEVEEPLHCALKFGDVVCSVAQSSGLARVEEVRSMAFTDHALCFTTSKQELVCGVLESERVELARSDPYYVPFDGKVSTNGERFITAWRGVEYWWTVQDLNIAGMLVCSVGGRCSSGSDPFGH